MKGNDHFFHSKACTCRTCASWSSSCCCRRAASSWRVPFPAAQAAFLVDGCMLAPSAAFVNRFFSYFFITTQIFFSWRQESKHAKEECFSGFSIVDKEFSLSDVHTFFTDSFLLKMGSYGIIFVNGRVCVSARQAGQVRYRFDCRNFEGGIVCCHARNLIC